MKDKMKSAVIYLNYLDQSGNKIFLNPEEVEMNPTAKRVNVGRFFLEKMLYLSNVMSLVTKDELMFERKEFKPFDNGPYSDTASMLSKKITQLGNDYSDLDQRDKEILSFIYNEFCNATYLDIYAITHEDLAWRDAFENTSRSNPESYFIDLVKFKDHYKKIYSGFMNVKE